MLTVINKPWSTQQPSAFCCIFRAYAVSQVKGQAAYGQAEKSLVTRRKLSLTASMPRIVRMDDVFMVGLGFWMRRGARKIAAIPSV
jgi:hypothetical protein